MSSLALTAGVELSLNLISNSYYSATIKSNITKYIVPLTVIFQLNLMRRMPKITFPSLQIQKCSEEPRGWGGGEVYVVVFFYLR